MPNLRRHRLTHLAGAALLTLLVASSPLLAQAIPQAVYPLATNLVDTTGNYGPITLLATSTPVSPPANGVCVNGVYLPQPTGQDVRTPLIGSLTPTDFELRLDFRVAAYPLTGTAPVIMAGTGARWIGIQVQANGVIGVKYNSGPQVWSTRTVALGTWYSAVVKHETGIIQLMLDGQLILQQAVPPLNTGGEFTFTTNDYSIGRNHNGCIRNLVIANNTTLAGAFPYGTGCQGIVLAANGAPVVGNAAFELVLSNLPGLQSLGLLALGSAVVNPGLDLTGIGMAGCRSFTNLDIGLLGPVVGSAGTVTFAFPIPASPSLSGLTAATQGVGFTNFTSLGLSASNGVRLVIAN
jgi:hypothetical protein